MRRDWYALLLGLTLVGVCAGLLTALMREYLTPSVVDDAAPETAAGPAPLTGRLVIFLVDSLRHDVAFDPALFPRLNAVKQGGAWGLGRSGVMTMTGISTHIIGTSVSPGIADMVRNFNMRAVDFNTVFDNVKQRGGHIALVGDVAWSQQFADRLDYAYSLSTTDPRLPGLDNLDVSDDRFLVRLDPSLVAPELAEAFHTRKRQLTAAAASDPAARSDLAEEYPGGREQPLLPNDEWDVLIVHLVGLDIAAHRHGIHHPAFRAKAQRVDQAFAGLLARLTPDTTVLFIADHGCTENGRHGSGDDIARATPIVMLGPGVRPGVQLEVSLYDYAPTIAALLGLPPSPAFEGRVITEALAVDDRARADIAVSALENRLRYLELWRERFARSLALPVAEARALRADLRAGSVPPAEITARAWASITAVNAIAQDAAEDGTGLVHWWIALGLAALLLVIAVARAERGLPPLAAIMCAGLVVCGIGGAFVAEYSRALAMVGLGLALVGLTAMTPRARIRRIHAVVLTALALQLTGALVLTLYDRPMLFALRAVVGATPGTVLLMGAFWTLQATLLVYAWRTRERWLTAAERHPVLLGAAFLAVFASLDGRSQVMRYQLIAMAFVVFAYLDRRRQPGEGPGGAGTLTLALVVLGVLFAWVVTGDHRFFGTDVRNFNVPAMTLLNLGLAAALLWRHRVWRGLKDWSSLGLGALFLGAPFLLRVVDSDALFQALFFAHVALLVGLAVIRLAPARRLALAQLAAVSLTLLMCSDRELQVTLIIAVIAAMAFVFDGDRWRGESWATCLALAVAIFAFRLVNLSVYEQWLSFASIEVTTGFLGNRSATLVYSAVVIFLKFMLPFLLVISLAFRRLTRVGQERVTLIVLFMLTARLLYAALLFLQHRHTPNALYDIVPELTFYATFLVSYILSTAIWWSIHGREDSLATPA